MRILVLALLLPVSAFGQVIGYDSKTGDPLDPAVIGAPPIRTTPEPEPKKKKKKRPKSRKVKKAKPSVARPQPKGQHHLHGEPPPVRTTPARPDPAHQAMLEETAGAVRARREEIQALEAKIRTVRSEIEKAHRRNPYRTRSRPR